MRIQSKTTATKPWHLLEQFIAGNWRIRWLLGDSHNFLCFQFSILFSGSSEHLQEPISRGPSPEPLPLTSRRKTSSSCSIPRKEMRQAGTVADLNSFPCFSVYLYPRPTIRELSVFDSKNNLFIVYCNYSNCFNIILTKWYSKYKMTESEE